MDSKTLDTFKSALKQHSLSLTKTRLLVLDMLYDKEPQSVNELLAQAKTDLDRVTLYRIIKLFERINVAQRVYTGWKYKIELTDEYSLHHHHLTCLKCERIIPITESREIEATIMKLAEQKSFRPTGHQLEIRGFCQSCQDNPAE